MRLERTFGGDDKTATLRRSSVHSLDNVDQLYINMHVFQLPTKAAD